MYKLFDAPSVLLADGTPIQPVLPSGNPMPKMVERESKGVECPASKIYGFLDFVASKEDHVH